MALPTETKILNLEFPVTHDGVEIKSLQFRRPRVIDNLQADKHSEHDGDKEVMMMSLLTGVDEEVIVNMDIDDYTAGQKIILGFRKRSEK